MKQIQQRNTAPSPELYPIRTVSQLTGVNAITLRAWESRHGLINPVRKDSGHRLYTQEDIDLIIRIAGLLDRGMRVGQVGAFLDAEKQQQLAEATAPGDEKSDTWRRYLEGMTAAIVNFNENGLEQIYNEALSHYSINIVTDRLLTPLLEELGKRWETGIGTVAEEHFFGFYLRNKLGARFHHRIRKLTGPKLLMACLPGERHEVGILLFALAANEAGYQTIVLGADMPLQELYNAAAKTAAEGIVLSGFLPPSSDIMQKQLPELAMSVDAPIFVGGHISAQTFDDLRKVGIEPLGTDIEMGLKKILEIVAVS